MRKFKFGGLVYDLSVMQIDKEIGLFFNYLKKEKIIENANLIITSDHGLKAGYPKRPETKIRSDLSQKFYDEFLRVPLILYPAVKNEINIDKLSSHIDFTPTILGLCNIEKPIDLIGQSIIDKNYSSDFILAENTGSGVCDLKKKNIYLCFKSYNLKITYEIINFNIKEREVFDIKNDPNEFNNIVNSQLFKNDREQMYIRAQKRLNKILEYVQ
tara:strand:+ start:124 stop:765 length:642 start_codon:yes stop_codon:yes gene_type:complete